MEPGDARNWLVIGYYSPKPRSEVGTEELGQFIRTGTWKTHFTFYIFLTPEYYMFLSDLLVEGSKHPGAVVKPGEGLDQAVGEPRLAHGSITLKLSTNQRPV